MTSFYYVPLYAFPLIADNFADKWFYEIKIASLRAKKINDIKVLPENYLTGLFMLADDEGHFVSFALVSIASIDRIFTSPNQRNKGYASKLLHEIVKFGIKNNITYLSPVDKNVEDLFLKANWIPTTNEMNKDSTKDYCHKLFHKKLLLSFPENIVEVDKNLVDAFNKILL